MFIIVNVKYLQYYKEVGFVQKMRYMISDASKFLDVEAHVLRYWEEETGLQIPRNDMGHRYYTDEEIEKFRYIKKLRDNGFSLKAIKVLIPDMKRVGILDGDKLVELRNRLEDMLGNVKEDKQCNVKTPDVLMENEEAADNGSCKNPEDKSDNITDISAIAKKSRNETAAEVWGASNNPEMSEKGRVEDIKNILTDIMSEAVKQNNEKLVREINMVVSHSVKEEIDYALKMKEEREEERFRMFDKKMRDYQLSRQQAAIAKSYDEKKKRSRFFEKYRRKM